MLYSVGWFFENTIPRRNNVKQSKIMRYLLILLKSSKVLKLFKIFKAGKILLSFATMSLSVFVYSFLMSPWFAVGFVVLLFVHEMGHVIALKLKKIPSSAPIFIPMLGAAVFCPKIEEPEDEAFVGIGGPLLGGLSALIMFLLWNTIPGKPNIFLVLGFFATIMNLFNLIPLRPLDGGRITQVIGPWFKKVGVALLLVVSFYLKTPFILLIWILALEDFRMKRNIKRFIATTCLLAMVALIVLGYSNQKLWVDITDIAFAILFTLSYFFSPIRDDEKEEQLCHQPVEKRVKWLAFYLLLSVFLVVFLFIQIPYLPKV